MKHKATRGIIMHIWMGHWSITGSPPFPSIKFTNSHLYTWVERGSPIVSCPKMKHNVPAQGLNLTTLTEIEQINIRPPHLRGVCVEGEG